MRTLPLACSLDAAALAERRSAISHLARRAVVGRHLEGTRLEVRLRAEAEAEIRQLAALERECCPFLEFEVRSGDPISVVVTGPPGSEPILERFLAA